MSSSQPADQWDNEAELAAGVARLSELLRQAAVDGRAIADKAASVADKHAKELGKERERTAAALLDLNELQHRIKNTLAIVQAMVRITLRPDVPYADARALLESRLAALARVQEMLFEGNWQGATLTTLVKSILAPHVGTNKSERIRVHGPDVDVGVGLSMVLALALNELATNASKYGALSGTAGCVEITWTLGPELRLRWRERDGPPVTPPLRMGFGSRLVTDSIRSQFNGTVELDFKPEGLLCTMTVPENQLKSL